MVYVAPTLLDGTPYPAATWQAALDEVARLSALVTLLPQAVRRTTDASPVVNNTLINDSSLVHTNALAVGSVYLWEQRLIYDSSAVANFQWGYTIPAGGALRFTVHSILVGGSTWQVADCDQTTALTAAGAGVGTTRSVLIRGLVIVGGAAGTLQTRWAQATTNASNTILKAQSYSSIQQVA